jgi:hypothetical protein
MQENEEVHPNHSIINLSKKRPDQLVAILTNESTISIDSSQINLTINGNRNRIKVEDSAGKFALRGNENQVEIRKSWITCEIKGDGNLFGLVQSEFQLKEHKGEGNFVPGFLGQNPVQLGNRRILMQERIINFRVNTQRINTNTIKKYWPNLRKSPYDSESRECPICYDDIAKGEEVTSLFCFHLFHSACIEACLETTTKCPVCSLDLLRYIHTEIKSGSLISQDSQLLMKESMEEENP